MRNANFGVAMLDEIYVLKDAVRKIRIGLYRDVSVPESRTERRAHEIAVTASCVARLLETEAVEISYEENGAPCLASSPEWNISLSHSKDWYAVMLCMNGEAGIDVQQMRPAGIASGMHYFMSEAEQEGGWTDRELYLIWSAKEALFKWKRGRVPSYKEDLRIHEIGSHFINAEACGEFVSCAYFSPVPDIVLVHLSPSDRG